MLLIINPLCDFVMHFVIFVVKNLTVEVAK